MTDIIDTILIESPQINKINSRQSLEVPESKILNGFIPIMQKKYEQNPFQFIIKQIHCPYDLLIIVNPQNVFAILKVSLLKKCGSLLKIQEQQSKTYLIKKFLAFDSIYRLQIDPFSGEIYFRFDYFQLKTISTPITKNQLKEIFQSLNITKLYQTVQKFVSFYQGGQLNSWKDNNFPFKNSYQQLAKAVCSIQGPESLHYFMPSSFQRDLGNSTQGSTQLFKRKEILAKIEQYVTMQKQSQTQHVDRKLLKKQIRQIQLENTKLGSLAKKKGYRGNLEVLQISKDTEKKVKDVIESMIEDKIPKHIMKIVESQMGNIILNLQQEHDPIYHNKIQFLSNLPKDIQYSFLDKYFTIHGSTLPVIITNCLKEQSLDRYLNTNSISLSIETKMRILLQVFNAVHTIWQDRQIILYITGFKKIALTKSMIVKIRNFNSYDKIDMFMMFQDKIGVNIKLLDNWLNLSRMYFKLFFNHSLVKPSSTFFGDGQLVDHLKPIVSAKCFVGTKFLPQSFGDPIKQIIMGLNYIFMSFIDKAYKIIVHFLKKSNPKHTIYIEQQFNQSEQQTTFNEQRLCGYKMVGCWILKNFDLITKEGL